MPGVAAFSCRNRAVVAQRAQRTGTGLRDRVEGRALLKVRNRDAVARPTQFFSEGEHTVGAALGMVEEDDAGHEVSVGVG